MNKRPIISKMSTGLFSAALCFESSTLVVSQSWYRERQCADTIGTVLVPWAGQFQCWNYFSYKIYGSSFIKQHSETIMVWNFQNADCSLKNKFTALFVIIFCTLSFERLANVGSRKQRRSSRETLVFRRQWLYSEIWTARHLQLGAKSSGGSWNRRLPTFGSCLFHEHITNSVTGVSQPPVLDCGTTCFSWTPAAGTYLRLFQTIFENSFIWRPKSLVTFLNL